MKLHSERVGKMTTLGTSEEVLDSFAFTVPWSIGAFTPGDDLVGSHSLCLENGRVVTYSRIGLLRSYGNLQSYWTTTKLRELTVVLDYQEAKGTYSRIGLLRS